jgi:hypothetical protein
MDAGANDPEGGALHATRVADGGADASSRAVGDPVRPNASSLETGGAPGAGGLPDDRADEPPPTERASFADGGVEAVDDGAPLPGVVPLSEPLHPPVGRARMPHARHGAYACAEVRGPNVVRFKLREGAPVELDARGQVLVARSGARLSAAESRDLATLAALRGVRVFAAFRRPAAELRALKARAEAESGDEVADLSPWFDALVGERLEPEVARADRTLCDETARVATLLDGLDLVETTRLHEPPSPPPGLPFLTQATDIPPATTWSREPPHLGPASAGGLDSPETLLFIPTNRQAAYQGLSVGIVDIEYDFRTHEKFNATWLGGVHTGTFYDHAHASMSVAFGTARSGGSGATYGIRGFAPQAARGFAGAVRSGFLGLGTVYDPADAVETAGDATDPGDLIFLEQQTSASGMFVPIDRLSDVADAIDAYVALGRVVLVPAANGNANLGATRSSTAIYVAGGTPNGMNRDGGSNFGGFVDLHGWGSGVWAASDPDNALACWMSATHPPGCAPPDTHGYQRYRSDFGGSSSATAIVTGALAQMQSMYEALYGRTMGSTGARNRTVLRDTARAGATIVPPAGSDLVGSFQPNVRNTIRHYIYQTRFGRVGEAGGAWFVGVPAPHHEFTSVQWPASGAHATLAHGGGIWSATPNAGVVLTEVPNFADRGTLDLGGVTSRDFAIALKVDRIHGPSSVWQTLVAKENPRNYGVFITPAGHGAGEGRVEFSYHPSDSGVFCAAHSHRRIDDGRYHSVVILFEATGTTAPPVLTFYIDGTFDRSVNGCTPGAPRNHGTHSVTTLGAWMDADSLLTDIRLYRRILGASEIAAYHGGTL